MQIESSIKRVITSGWFVLGPEVNTFEQAFASYLGAKHCISLANGTDAIEIALKALGVSPGDQVATAANAGMYTSTATMKIGAQPYFMDVDLDTQEITLAEVSHAIDRGVKAIVATHLFGLVIPEIIAIAELCVVKGIPLLEDCAQVHGAKISGKCAGTFGDASSFSFYPTKNLGALGDGGAVVTNNSEVAKKITLLRQYGWAAKYQVMAPNAHNSRLDELQAAILSGFLPHLDSENARRREIANRYNEQIHHPKILKPCLTGDGYVAHLYVIRSQMRDQLREHLLKLNIASDVHYPIPDHRQPVFGNRFARIHLPNTEHLATKILTLPCYPEMSNEEVDLVIAAVNSWQT